MKVLQSIVLIVLAGCIHIATAEEDAKYFACYSSAGSMTPKAKDEFQSRGKCRATCTEDPKTNGGDGYAVMAMTRETNCYCGNKLPHKSLQVPDSKCKSKCPGFDSETCGSRLGEYFSVYTTGLEDDPETDPSPTSSSSSASKSSSSSSDTASTAFSSTTDPPSSSQEQTQSAKPESSTVSKAGIAAGAVVGVLAIIALGVGVWIFLRRRRRQKIEGEYRKSVAVRGFVQKPASDHRLDPGMVQRRDSVGSIADNQDYSRRILKVTNPDG